MSDDCWWVYLLLCQGDRIYTGIARDVRARYQQHLTGKGARFTRAFPPERVLACRAFASQSEALREEARIKRLPRLSKLALVSCWQAGQETLLPESGFLY